MKFNSHEEDLEEENSYSYHSNGDLEAAAIHPENSNTSPNVGSKQDIDISLKSTEQEECLHDGTTHNRALDVMDTEAAPHSNTRSNENDHESTLHAMTVSLWNHHSNIFHRHKPGTYYSALRVCDIYLANIGLIILPIYIIHHIPAVHDTNVFLFSRPYLFFESIKLLLMLIAMYCALWLIQYLPAKELSAEWKVTHPHHACSFAAFIHMCAVLLFLKVYSVIPLLMTAANFVIVVKSAVLLKAIHEIDKESMMEVIEQTEGAVSYFLA